MSRPLRLLIKLYNRNPAEETMREEQTSAGNIGGYGRVCPFCGSPSPELRCPTCGLDTTAPRRPCPNCKRMIPTANTFCSNCGAKFKGEMRWKVPLIILIFVIFFILSVLIRVLMG